jgi:hypothetical protein
VLSLRSPAPSSKLVAIDIIAAGGEVVDALDMRAVAEHFEYVDRHDYRTGWVSADIDVAAAAGERVYLRARSDQIEGGDPRAREGITSTPPPPITLAVDRIELLTAGE